MFRLPHPGFRFATARALLVTLLVALAVFLARPSLAGGVVPDSVVRAEVLPGWTTKEGTRMTALRLTLAPGWKTYWRAPGDAGIPPLFNWSGSRNLHSVVLHWPRPRVFMTNGLRTIGYADELVLPMEFRPVDPGSPIILNGEVELGVCETVCVPATLKFSASLEGRGKSDPAIHAALADRPVSASRAGVGTVTCSFSPISDGLELTAQIQMPRIGKNEVVLVETADPAVWVAQPESARSGDLLSVSTDLVPPTGAALRVDRSRIRFTVLGDRQAVDIRGCTPG